MTRPLSIFEDPRSILLKAILKFLLHRGYRIGLRVELRYPHLNIEYIGIALYSLINLLQKDIPRFAGSEISAGYVVRKTRMLNLSPSGCIQTVCEYCFISLAGGKF